jgi:hypothetical protein
LGGILGSLNILGHHHPPQYFQFPTPPQHRSPKKPDITTQNWDHSRQCFFKDFVM